MTTQKTDPVVRAERRARVERLLEKPDRLMQMIVEHVSNGAGLWALTQKLGVPHMSIVRFLDADPARRAEYDRARVVGADALIQQAIEEFDKSERDDAGMLTGPGVALARAKAENLRWVAERIAPKNWMPAVRHEHATVDVNVLALLDARRVQLEKIINGEVVRDDLENAEFSRSTRAISEKYDVDKTN